MKKAFQFSGKKIGSLFLSVCMIMTMLPTMAFAEDAIQDSGLPLVASGKIIAFAALDEDIASQTVETGTAEDELKLPNELEVTVITEAIATDSGVQEETIETTIPVFGWTSNPPYNCDLAGDYIFTPTLNLPDGLTLADGVSSPTLTATVEEKAAPQARGDMAPGSETPLPYILSHGSDGLYSGVRLAIPGLNGESFTFRTLPQMIETIRNDANGRDVEIRLYASITETGVLDIGAGQARFENSSSERWGHITLTGSIRSGSTGWATVYLSGVSAEIQAEIQNDDGGALVIGNDSIVDITSGYVTCNADHPAFFAVKSFGNGSMRIRGGKVWATFGGTPVYIADSSTVEISGTPEIQAKDNTHEAVVMNTADGRLTLGGTPEIRGTICTWVGKLAVDGFTPSQNRYTLTMKGTPGVGDVAVQSGKEFIRNFKLTNENLYLTTSTNSNDLLVTNIQPSPTNYVITGSGGSFSATYGENGNIPIATGTLDAVIQGIGVDAMGELCAILLGDGNETLDIGTGTATFAKGSEFTWGELTLSGKITSASDAATVLLDGITVSSNADIANSGNGDGIALMPNRGILNIVGGNITAESGSAVSNLLPIGAGFNSILNISGTAVLSSANYRAGVNELEGGTLYVTTGTRVNINGGTIRNTAAGNAVFSDGPIALSGSPDISGAIRVNIPNNNMSVGSNFVPGSKTYPLTVYELSGSILNQPVVVGGAAFINNFSLTNKGYELAVSGDDLVVGLAAKKISLTPTANKDFGCIEVGYTAPIAHSVTVSNAGTEATGDLTIALSGADAASFILSKNAITSLAKDGTDSFTVAPKEGLSAKTYNATVTVSGGADIMAQSFAVTFNVVESGTNPTVTEITGFEAIPDENVGKAGSVSCANALVVMTILPRYASAIHSGTQKVDWPIANWEDTDGYNPNKAGSYTFTATLSLAPDGYANSAGHTCAVEVVVSPADSTVYSLTVTNGTGGGNYDEGAAVTLVASAAPSGQRFKEWSIFPAVTFVEGTSKNSSTTKFIMPAQAVTATAIYVGNSSGDSGTSSGGGDPSSGSPTTTTKTPDQPVTVAVPVTATAGENGAASASIPEKSVTDAIVKAQADAKAQGKTANGIAVALNITMPKGATDLTVTLTRNSLNSLVSAGVTSLELNGSPVTVFFDKKVLEEIQKKSVGNISITIVLNSSLSASAKAIIGTRPVYDLTVNYGSGKTVSSFGGGTAMVFVPYKPAKGETIGGLYAVYIDKNGNATRIAGSAYDANSGCVFFTTTHFSLYGIGYTTPSVKFTDISSHWGKEAIDYVIGRELLFGTTETTFAPDTATTREMLVTALGRLAGVDVKAYNTNSFTDVKTDSAFRPYIEWAYQKGIVQGIGSNQFAPDRAVSREEIAVIFENYAKATGYTLPVTHTATTYADDSDIGSAYKTAVTAMQQSGIMMGGTGNKFYPKANATRAEVSSMLHRYIKLIIDPDTTQG